MGNESKLSHHFILFVTTAILCFSFRFADAQVTEAAIEAGHQRDTQILVNSGCLGGSGEVGLANSDACMAPSTTPETVPTPTARPDRSKPAQQQADPARARAERAVANCESAASAVDGNACSTDASNPAMADAYSSVSENSDSSTSGMTDTCGKPGSSSSKASQAISNVRGTCQSAYTTCSSACSSAASSGASGYSDLRSRLSRAQARCENATNKMAGMDAGTNHVEDTSNDSQKCQNEVNDQNRESQNALNDKVDRSGCSDPAYAAQNAATCGGVTAPPTPTTTTNTQITDSGTDESNWSGSDNGGFGGSSHQSSGDDNSGEVRSGGGEVAGIGSPGGAGLMSDGGANAPGGRSSKPAKATDQNTKFGSANFSPFGGGAKKNTGRYNQNGSWIPDKVGANKPGEQTPNMDRFRPDMQMRGPAGENLDPKMWACRKSWQVIWDGPNEAHDFVMKSSNPMSLTP